MKRKIIKRNPDERGVETPSSWDSVFYKDMKNNNYITIAGWMINELYLSGNELLCYALIYGFSQDEESCYKGSRKYIASLIGAKSLTTVDRVLKNLISKRLIIKDSNTINEVVFNSYRVNKEIDFFKKCAPPTKNEYPYTKNEYDNNSNINSYKEEKDKSFSKKDELFEQCWEEYRKKGSKKEARVQWDKLSEDDKEKVLPHIKAYVASREIQFQRDFQRYLKDKLFKSIVVVKNNVIYDPDRFNSNTYNPQCDGVSLMWNDFAKCYLTPFDINDICDGYNKDNRPDNALVMWQGWRYKWSASEKKWIKQC